jgi:prepilin-type N-terminal cleavage/methylation domain-containing protein
VDRKKQLTHNPAGPRRRRGLSLPEVMISAFLVGVVLVAAMKTVGAVFQTRRISAEFGEADVLARQLMTEILQARYEDPDAAVVPVGEPANPLGVETGEGSANRADFDDVDDYFEYSSSPPEDKAGNPLAGHVGYARSVVVKRVDANTLQQNAAAETGLKQIIVIVTPPVGDPVSIKALRSRFGAVEQPPPVDTTFVTRLSGKLQTGGSPVVYDSAKNLVNHAKDQ